MAIYKSPHPSSVWNIDSWPVSSKNSYLEMAHCKRQSVILFYENTNWSGSQAQKHKQNSWRVFHTAELLWTLWRLAAGQSAQRVLHYIPLWFLSSAKDGSMWTQKSQMSWGCVSAWQLLLTLPHIHGNCLSLNPSWMAAMLLSFGIWQKLLCRNAWLQQV